MNGGTDIWYAYVIVDLSVPSTPADDFVLAPAVRLTDNWQGLYGLSGSVNPIFDGTGANVDPDQIEKGQTGASRANIGMVGTTAIVAYEETKATKAWTRASSCAITPSRSTRCPRLRLASRAASSAIRSRTRAGCAS